MPFPSKTDVDALKKIWTDKYVKVNPDRADLQRFADRTGRVITVNYGGCAIVDFCDGGWYDIPDFEAALLVVEDGSNYDGTVNTAQKAPVRQ